MQHYTYTHTDTDTHTNTHTHIQFCARTHTHAHPCCLLTWYRLCIETAPAEAGAVRVPLSESPHTHAHLHSLTYTSTHIHTYTHTHWKPLWWLVRCCMCRCNIIFRWEDFYVTMMVVITLLPCKYTFSLSEIWMEEQLICASWFHYWLFILLV